jgi:chromosome segregation ATPase
MGSKNAELTTLRMAVEAMTVEMETMQAIHVRRMSDLQTSLDATTTERDSLTEQVTELERTLAERTEERDTMAETLEGREKELAATTEAMLAERAAKEAMAAMVQDPLTYMTVGEKVATPELMDTLATAREIRLMAQEVMDALVLMAVRAQTDDNAPGS